VTDAGRICRPLFVVETGADNKKRLAITKSTVRELKELQAERVDEGAGLSKEWEKLITSGSIEYIDTEEEEVCPFHSSSFLS